MSSKFRLDGRVAVVTGAGRGIGREIALTLARHGAKIALIARTRHQLEEVASDVERDGAVALPLSCDITDNAALSKAFERVGDELGGLDILVNNAGINIRKRIDEVEDGDWSAVLSTNLKAAFNCCRLAAPYMRRRRWGRIVNIGSVAGSVGVDTGTPYAASKAALSGMTRSLAIELAQDNILVNCVAPWYFLTPLTESIINSPEIGPRIIRRTPLRRVGNLDELASVVLFLSCEASSYVTGQTIAVDGGMSIFGFSPIMEC
ncbi:MAG: 3-oxoacyl-[acyl-carrier-protein] reductase [Planctomycetota bacterium]